MSLITYPLNNIEYTAEDAELFNATRKSGIFFKDDFPYSISGETNTIVIGEGLGWIRNDKFKGKVIALKAPEAVTLDIADSVLPRIDAIVIQFDINANATNIVVKKGTPGSTPAPPSVTRNESVYELHLYHIYRKPGSLSISFADVTDLRINEDYCGLMADSVTSIDTSALNAQTEELINALRNAINEISNEDKIFSYIKMVGNPYNFFDNSDFRNPVNQRGQKSYLGLYSGVKEKNYTIDRWLNYFGNVDIYVEDGHLRIVNNTTYTQYIEQRFPYGTFDSSKVYTIVKKGTDGVYEVVRATINHYPNEGLDVVSLYIRPGEVQLEWVALYEGEYDYTNFPVYHPKGYATELAECKRYFERITQRNGENGNKYFAFTANANDTDATYAFARITFEEKRIVPTVVNSGVFRWEWWSSVGGNLISSATTVLDAIGAEKNAVVLRGHTQSVIQGYWLGLQLTPGTTGYLDVVADL